MSKTKLSFFCSNCGHESPKWLGKCPSCEMWNTLIEEVVHKEHKAESSSMTSGGGSIQRNKPQPIGEIDLEDTQRYKFEDNELNRVLGGGLVPGSLVLIGGEPGIGKSTLMLQIAIEKSIGLVLYVSGEESEKQIRLRAERIGIKNTNCLIYSETLIDNIINQSKHTKPSMVIVDSVQTLYSPSVESLPGSISQIRECTAILNKFAKETQTPVFLIGHITKDGSIAGPKLLEHMVDTVLQFEGDKNYQYRILRSLKNRFGSTSELGIYEMKNTGLQEVPNPSKVLLSHREDNLSGIAIASTIEGMRPILVEIQALVSTAVYGTPQRSTTGFDIRRLNMLLAVLEKRCGFRLGVKDVFLNITGGLKVDDPAIDMAVISAILSSNEDIAIDTNVCFAAEIGLSGEIRPVQKIEQRVSEAAKLGFERIIISYYNAKEISIKPKDIEVIGIKKVTDAFSYLFG